MRGRPRFRSARAGTLAGLLVLGATAQTGAPPQAPQPPPPPSQSAPAPTVTPTPTLAATPVPKGLLPAGKILKRYVPPPPPPHSKRQRPRLGAVTPSPLRPRVRLAAHGFWLQAARYRAFIRFGPVPDLEIYDDFGRVARLPLVATLDSLNHREALTTLRFAPLRATGPAWTLDLTATSRIAGRRGSFHPLLWRQRRFHWVFGANSIEFWQTAVGRYPLGRCYFLSQQHRSPAGNAGAELAIQQTFSPSEAGFYAMAAQPLRLGLPDPPAPKPGIQPPVFVPPPLFLALRDRSEWIGVGLGARVNDENFAALTYSGLLAPATPPGRKAKKKTWREKSGVAPLPAPPTAAFWIDYRGLRTGSGEFTSPHLLLNFSYSPWDGFQSYSAWIASRDEAPPPSLPQPEWHRRPVFDAWGEALAQSSLAKQSPDSLLTQANYERWLRELAARGIWVGSIVIGGHWERKTGTLRVDRAKWPHLRSFVLQQHLQGRRVLLWLPAYSPVGLPHHLCVQVADEAVAADVTNPSYRSFLRSRLSDLIQRDGVDGFVLVGADNPTTAPMDDRAQYAPRAGIAFLHRFEEVVWKELHHDRPDGLLLTSSLDPAFHDVSDGIQLEPVQTRAAAAPVSAAAGKRGPAVPAPDLVKRLRRRVRLARLAGYFDLNCGNADSGDLTAWWHELEAEPGLCTPSLDVIHATPGTLKLIAAVRWKQLGHAWNRYARSVTPRLQRALRGHPKPPPVARPVLVPVPAIKSKH